MVKMLLSFIILLVVYISSPSSLPVFNITNISNNSTHVVGVCMTTAF